MRRTKFVQKLERWGKRNLKTDDVEEALRHLYLEKNLRIVDIAKKFGAGRDTVCNLLKRFHITKRAPGVRFDEEIEKLGYADAKTFFTAPKIAGMSREAIADLLGCSSVCVWTHYERFLEAEGIGKPGRDG